jgi:DNA (cytosine-5)-methyltransferase 1
MTHLDLFSGIGGFALAARWAGIETVQFVENEEFAQKVLTKNFPGVPIHDDIKTYRANGIVSPFLLTGGYPCQPFSQAGRRRGQNDDRHLWPEMFRVIQECRPNWVLAENVTGHIKLGLQEVLADLEGEGYQSQVFHIGALAKDAPHRRMRVWIVAHSQYSSDRTKRGEEREEESIQGVNRQEGLSGLPGGTGSDSRDVAYSNSGLSNRKGEEICTGRNSPDNGSKNVANSECKRLEGFRGECELGESGEKRQVGRSGDVADSSIFRSKTGIPGSQQGEEGFTGIINNSCSETGGGERCSTGVTQPGLGGTLSDGISTWMDEPDIPRVGVKIPDRAKRLKAIGNAIVPQVAYEIIRHMKEVT